MTDAPVDLDQLQSYCDAAAGLPGATAIGVDSRDLARLIAELRAARAVSPKASGLLFTDEWLRKGIASDGDSDTEAGLPLPLFEPTPMIAEPLSPERFQAAARFHAAPPADEVAGLLEGEFLRLRTVLQTAVLPLGRSRQELVAMLDRIENHLKGKR